MFRLSSAGPGRNADVVDLAPLLDEEATVRRSPSNEAVLDGEDRRANNESADDADSIAIRTGVQARKSAKLSEDCSG